MERGLNQTEREHMETRDSLLEMLVDIGTGKPAITEATLATYQAEAEKLNCNIEDVLVTHGVITPKAVAQARATQFGVEFVDLDTLVIPPEVIAALSSERANHFQVVPIEKFDSIIRVAIADPSDLDAIDGLQHTANLEIEVSVASKAAIETALRKYYPLSCEGGIE